MSTLAPLKESEVWLVTGSQHLYGPETLKQVAHNSRTIAEALDRSPAIPCRVVFKPVVKTPEEVLGLLSEANAAPACVGLVFWMHTFSPAKMWIAGLGALRKPYAHLHTQFNRDLPWDTIDMDFMNLNQAAHGDREFGHICTRLRQNRKVVVGHWQDEDVHHRLAVWMRAACAWADSRRLKLVRFGDNMREVAVTEGDKVSAQRQLGYSVNGHGVGNLVARIAKVADAEVDRLVKEYSDLYEVKVSTDQMGAVRGQARIELGLRAFLGDGGYAAFTDTFEDLHGLEQLPGLAVQRLMAEGYGFGAEGDWKTAALVRAVKVMATGLPGGSSFMEDYTYHLDPKGGKVLGAHMLEVCPTIAQGRPTLEVHPLSIGGKAPPARLVFTAAPGRGLNAALIDHGNRFRLVVNAIEVVVPDAPLPKLPVARALWVPKPDLKTAAAAWIYAGSSHHTAFSVAVTPEHLQDFALMADVEFVLIDEETRL
ncbi:MAG TPA: L-arabinose isomerase, partial [Vicinamibacteria bacterium]